MMCVSAGITNDLIYNTEFSAVIPGKNINNWKIEKIVVCWKLSFHNEGYDEAIFIPGHLFKGMLVDGLKGVGSWFTRVEF